MLLLRFLLGGSIVCIFASLADGLQPKTFAGIFGAAPSVALATLGLTVSHEGRLFAADEARAMMAGAFCFVLYASVCVQLIARYRWSAFRAAVASLTVWAGTAAATWFFLLR